MPQAFDISPGDGMPNPRAASALLAGELMMSGVPLREALK